jgi:histidinol phosphatase-like PHP family hydrolase
VTTKTAVFRIGSRRKEELSYLVKEALAKEIFNDWDAVVAFVHHPELPPTNNEAERASSTSCRDCPSDWLWYSHIRRQFGLQFFVERH